MALEERLDNDLKKALKAGEKEKLIVLRGLKSEIKYRRIDKGEDLTEADVVAVLASSAKKVRDSIEQFEKGGRADLVAKEKFGLAIIQDYLPEQLSEEKIRELVVEAIAETGADSPQKVGLVMKAVMPKLKGQADGKLVNRLAMEILAK
jgi:hypothetical protein